MTIGKKLASIIGINILVTMTVAGVGVMCVSKMTGSEGHILQGGNAVRATMSMDMMHDGIRADVVRGLLAAFSEDSRVGDVAEIKDELQEHIQNMNEAMGEVSKINLSSETVANLAAVKPSVDAYTNMASEIMSRVVGGNTKGGFELLPPFQKAFEQLEGDLEKLSEGIVKINEDYQVEATEEAGSSKSALIWLTAIGALIGLGLVVVTHRSIASMLRDTIVNLSNSSTQLNASAKQVAKSAQALAEGATEQASSLSETASSLEEVASASRQSADNSQQAYQLSIEVKNASINSVSSMNDMTKAISNIKQAADETAEIIKIIDGIAFQTNLLALNAAVEAAADHDRRAAPLAQRQQLVQRVLLQKRVAAGHHAGIDLGFECVADQNVVYRFARAPARESGWRLVRRDDEARLRRR